MKKLLNKLLFKLETKTLFYPMRKSMPPLTRELQGAVEDVYFQTEDGVKLNSWYMPGTFGRPVIIYCHGQAENIGYYQAPLKFLFDNGFGVLALEYRGHGKSEGKPTEEGVYTDVEAAIHYLSEEQDIHIKDMVLWGRSLGGAVVAEMATRHKVKGVILESTFTSIVDAANSILDNDNNHEVFGPGRKMLFRLANVLPTTQEFKTEEKMKKIKSPIFIAHSKKDDIISYKLAQRNAEKNPNAQLFLSNEGSHDFSEWAFPAILDFLDSLN